MSSTASAQRARLPHAAPRMAQAALERARLSVVPRRRTTAPRVPFVTFVSIILLGGVIGLLLFNTSMQQASFQATALQKQATDLSAQQEALEMDLQSLREPQRVARAAQRLGMVIPATPAGVLHLGSGRISGQPTPASAADSIPLNTPAPSKPAQLERRVVKVKVKAPATDPAAAETAAGKAAKAKRAERAERGAGAGGASTRNR
ncbi:hypothetical protein JK386_11215 [Nocardioides sp. zg-536]|uniref:Cell division protein FtsL n=1 Tax=Nocardioides faecalis TaxID=2803858 RepID=A0A938Y5L1_9ACTN|nr:hypothetical protein [Nocardioides faecalis]MBM9460473.1 hypothetical protein [Nocardioides faecalis]MBS4752282.1 hypothetical protein [Nocardioides faecalis]QVI57588.1 hypothetical protein KG111_10855 [Nocardioides faecalis]